jgi:hypothetical protein
VYRPLVEGAERGVVGGKGVELVAEFEVVDLAAEVGGERVGGASDRRQRVA